MTKLIHFTETPDYWLSFAKDERFKASVKREAGFWRAEEIAAHIRNATDYEAYAAKLAEKLSGSNY